MPGPPVVIAPEAADMRRRGRSLSDLHLLTRRSTAQQYQPAIEAAADDADLFVLNGDIFDFKWSTEASVEDSVASAEEWIRDLVDPRSGCRFVFLIGNHDNIDSYKALLQRLSGELPNLDWEEYYLHLGDKVFLHGDVVHRATTPELLDRKRRKFAQPRPKGPVANAMYDGLTRSRIHVGVTHIYPKKIFLRRVISYLRNVLPDHLDDLQQVYIGHLHDTFADLELDGLTFHSSGAAIDGLTLNIFEFEYDDTEL